MLSPRLFCGTPSRERPTQDVIANVVTVGGGSVSQRHRSAPASPSERHKERHGREQHPAASHSSAGDRHRRRPRRDRCDRRERAAPGGPTRPPSVQVPPSAPQSGPSASPSSAPAADWAPLDLPPLEAAATLEPAARDDAGIQPGTAFTLSSLTGEPASALADRLVISPATAFTVSSVRRRGDRDDPAHDRPRDRCHVSLRAANARRGARRLVGVPRPRAGQRSRARSRATRPWRSRSGPASR